MPHFNNLNKATLLLGLVVFVRFLLLRVEAVTIITPGCNVVKDAKVKVPTFYIRQSPPDDKNSSAPCYLNSTLFLKQIGTAPPTVPYKAVVLQLVCLDRMRLVFNKANSEDIVLWKFLQSVLVFTGPCLVTVKDLVTWANSIALVGISLRNNSVLLDKNDTSKHELSALLRMTTFIVINNKFKNVPAIFTQVWPNVMRLVLFGVKIKTFPRKLRYTMPNLQSLYVRYGKLTKPPEFPWTSRHSFFPSFRKLVLDYNNIADLANFTFCGEIRVVSVRGNRLKTIGSKCFDRLQGTETLDLSYNLLSYIPPGLFANLHSLMYIYLQNNFLTILQKGLMSNLSKLKEIHLENNQIEIIEDGAFPEQSLKIQKIYLNNNYIKRFPPWMFLLGNIQTIDLSKNLITYEAFTKPLDSLNTSQSMSFCKMHYLKLGQTFKQKTLNLTSNRIRKLSLKNFSQSKKTNLKSVLKLFRVDLTEIPILCNCETLQMANFVREEIINKPLPMQTTSRSFDTWKCAKPVELNGSPVMSALRKKCSLDNVTSSGYNVIQVKCLSDKALAMSVNETPASDMVCEQTVSTRTKNERKGFNFKTLVYAFIPLFCLLFLVILGLKYQGELKAYLYVRFHWHPFDSVDDSDPDKVYDAFVSYNSHDETWVYDTLRDTLENREPPYHLCLHERDFVIGASIQENIFHSVKRSKRMIMVLSQHFIRSEWCMLEFRAAHHRVLQDRTRYLIIILMEDVRMCELDEELKMYIRTNTYLSVKNKWFWEKLLYALPQRPLNSSNTNHRSTWRTTSNGGEDEQGLLRP